MARCGKCGETDEAEFYPSELKKSTGQWCKGCRSDYNRQRVADDRDYFLKHQRKRRIKTLDLLREYKAERGCERCGEKDPACLDFHHRDKAQKLYSISQEANRRNKGVETLMTEIQKCSILCANCHRKEEDRQRRTGAEQ
jgi:hypothetical protein